MSSKGHWVTLQGLASFQHSDINKVPEGTVCKSLGDIVYIAVDRNWLYKNGGGLLPTEKQLLRELELATGSLSRPDASVDHPLLNISKYKVHIVDGRIVEYFVEKLEHEKLKKESLATYLTELNKLPNYGIF